MLSQFKLIGAVVLLIVIIIFFYKYVGLKHYSTEQKNINQNKMEPTPTESVGNLFPEPNTPPYYYVNKDWVSINDDWQVRINKVISDGRCPSGVQCVWAGQAKIQLQLQQKSVDYYKAYYEELVVDGLNRFPVNKGALKNGISHPVTISRKDAITNKEYSFDITLLDLDPYPTKDTAIDLNNTNYTGLIRVDNTK